MLPLNQFCNLPQNFLGRKSLKLSRKNKFYWLSMQTYLLRMFEHFTECRGKRYCKYNECAGWSA